MPQHLDAIRPSLRYTRADFTALRAWLQKVEPEIILRLYYTEDDLQRFPTPARLVAFLETMRDDLIDRLTDANPNLAQALSHARQSHVWSKTAIDYLVNVVDAKEKAPHPKDPISQWMKPIVASKLKNEGIHTLGDLVSTIRRRGRGWYRPIPYLGRDKAARIVNWLRRHESSLGALPPLEGKEPVALFPVQIQPAQGGRFAVAPLERMAIASELDGSCGLNRHSSFPLIEARNDWQAVESYLYRYRGHDKTYRAYQKELERFLLWCITERGKALSSVLVGDCEAYKDFLDAIPDRWIGVRKPRRSPHWKPFAGQLSQLSKRYAVQVLRAFFEWLCRVRYLAANPWVAVQDPPVEEKKAPIDVDKALPDALWNKLTAAGGILDTLCALSDAELNERYQMRGFARRIPHAAQLRLVRAVVLILGDTGLRREELAYAVRRNLQPHPSVEGIWRLDVLGKRSKWRSVYLNERDIEALKAHWTDRGEDFSFSMTDLPLVSPIVIPPTRFGQNKHQSPGRPGSQGFSPDGLYDAVTAWLGRIASDDALDLSERERTVLRTSGLHAFRHTFGTLAVADNMPLDVVQKILGHASLNTTSIYVQSEDKRAATEVEKWVSRRMHKKSN